MPYGATRPLDMSGRCTLRLSYGEKEIEDVSHTLNRGVSLLSRSASRALGLITLNYMPQEVNQLTVVSQDRSQTHPLLQQFEEICEGVGCHKHNPADYLL